MNEPELLQKDLRADLPECWKRYLAPFFKSSESETLKEFLKEEIRSGAKVYPQKENIFRAFKTTHFDDVRVVILGQDPYHQPGQAEGLCFSVPDDVGRPPSLRNIFQELSSDLNIMTPKKNSLQSWARQGVLLLNTTLTVRDSQAASHSGKGWELLTDLVISSISTHKKDVIFVLWGGFARAKKKLIDLSEHHLIESAHPSPLSAYRGFMGSKPFSKVNRILEGINSNPINWQL